MDFLMQVCTFLASVVGLYSVAIIVRIILGWFAKGQRNQFTDFLAKIVDPYLAMFRGANFLKRSNIDFTPMLALMTLNIVQSILNIVGKSGHITIAAVAALIIQGLWNSLFSFFFIIILVLLVVRFLLGRSTNINSNNWINMIDPIINDPVSWVYKTFYKGKKVDDQKLVLTTFIVFLVLYIIIQILLALLVGWLTGI